MKKQKIKKVYKLANYIIKTSYMYLYIIKSTASVTAEGTYSEPYNLKNKKLLPHHEYDLVTGTHNT